VKLLLYCTKAKLYLRIDNKGAFWTYTNKQLDFPNTILNGKIVAECDFEVDKILPINVSEDDYDYGIPSKNINLSKESCLDTYDICEYLEDYNADNIFKKGYAIHIKNLHIFDEPKELSEFYNIQDCGGMLFTHTLKKAPQNMMRVSVNRWLYGEYTPNDVNILISIRPEWLCKILNGEKTIEVRKKVLKGMLK